MTNKFGRNLRQLREAAGMTQYELAEKLGITAAAVGLYETGKREPKLLMEEKMADVFGVSLDALHGRETPTNSQMMASKDLMLLAEFVKLVQKYQSESEDK